MGCNPKKDRHRLFQNVGVQFQEGGYQTEIKVSELCEETACLYEAPVDWKKLCEQFGIGNKIGNAVKSLSGGERQRLFIVLALIPNPELVFLDELTTGLDAKARRDVWKILSELKSKGLTIFLTSHFMDEVEALCDKIYFSEPLNRQRKPVSAKTLRTLTLICFGISVTCFKWE